MKRKKSIKWIALMTGVLCSITVSANQIESAPVHSKHTLTYNNKGVNYLKIILDEHVAVDLELANESINSAAPLKAMQEQGNGFGAVNGTYFSAYDGDMPLPYGTVIKDGKVLHKSTVGATVGFTDDNKMLMDYVDIFLGGYKDGVKTWYAWNVNRPTTASGAVTIYTDEYKGKIPMTAGAVGVVTQNNKVLKYITTTQSVPVDGFIVVYNEGVADRAYDLSVGSMIDYKPEYRTTYTEASAWDDVVTAISAGPSMILEGQVTNKPKEEGFTEDKITKNPAARSFIGFKEPNMLIVGMVNGATINDMVGIAKTMGLKSAMCLDGGGSSALYYNNAYVSGPGRDINNALVFSKAIPPEEINTVNP